jgi:hypothetical protein
MVKKLISGILKKGDEKSKEEVPEELPSLGEDTASKEEKKEVKEETKEQEAQKTEEAVPEELPSLEEEKVEEKKPELVATRPEPKKEEEPKHEEIEKVEKEEEKEVKEAKPLGDGFFASLSKLLSKDKSVDSIVSQDLLANMKESWNIRKESAKTGLSSLEEKNVSTSINEVLTQLKLMESKWRAHKMVLEEDEKLLKEQEAKIKEKEKEFKKLLRQYKLYKHVPDDKVILLKNSIPIRNISELINALRRMDSKTFASYVNKTKNEFSSFAASIDKALGSELKNCSTKADMLKTLEKFVRSVR